MPMKDDHPAKRWAAGFGRVSLETPHLNQDSPENHVRVNRETAARFGLKIKSGYEFYDRGITGSKTARAEGIRARGRQPKNQPTTWGLSTVSELLRNPVLVGWRQHRGQVVLSASAEETPCVRTCPTAARRRGR